jgi:hypothetical protein
MLIALREETFRSKAAPVSMRRADCSADKYSAFVRELRRNEFRRALAGHPQMAASLPSFPAPVWFRFSAIVPEHYGLSSSPSAPRGRRYKKVSPCGRKCGQPRDKADRKAVISIRFFVRQQSIYIGRTSAGQPVVQEKAVANNFDNQLAYRELSSQSGRFERIVKIVRDQDALQDLSAIRRQTIVT